MSERESDQDLNVKGVLLFALGLVLLLVVAAAAMYFVTVGIRYRDEAGDSPPTPILQEAID